MGFGLLLLALIGIKMEPRERQTVSTSQQSIAESRQFSGPT